MSEPAVAELRASVRRAVASSSLRAVADQVGVTHRGLAKFIDGSRPRSGTVRKLTAWYVSHAPPAEPLSPATARAALALLLAGIPAGKLDRLVPDVAARIRQACVDAAVAPPAWTDALAAD